MAEAKEKEKKKPVAKSKLSKPVVKKPIQYRIDISPDAVKVVRVDAKGKILSAGHVPFDCNMPTWGDKGWIGRLSQAVREASRAAKVPKGTNFACSVVAGGVQVILHSFTWPELAHNNMLDNARHEIASFLPGAEAQFMVGAEVQRRNEGEEGKPPTMDVFVAAMPKEMAVAISTAVTWAGYKVISLDVKENVRTRLVERYCRVADGVPKSYAILDLSSEQPSISLFLGGFFYSTHYFSGGVTATPEPEHTIDEIDTLMQSLPPKRGDKKEVAVEHNVEAVLSEISFVVDFIRYQERGSALECILIFGQVQSGFVERLAAGLGIPVHSTDTWMAPGVVDGVKGDPGFYLDAFASGIPSTVINAKHMMNLKTDVIVKRPMQRLFALGAAIVALMIGALAVGILIPIVAEQSLQNDYNRLDDREADVNRTIARAQPEHIMQQYRNRVEFLSGRIQGVHDFYAEFAQAAVIVPIIFEAGFTDIFRITAEEDTVVTHATAFDFYHTADLLRDFRDHWLFRTAGVATVVEHDTRNNEFGTAELEAFSVIMYRGMGVLADE